MYLSEIWLNSNPAKGHPCRVIQAPNCGLDLLSGFGEEAENTKEEDISENIRPPYV